MPFSQGFSPSMSESFVSLPVSLSELAWIAVDPLVCFQPANLEEASIKETETLLPNSLRKGIFQNRNSEN